MSQKYTVIMVNLTWMIAVAISPNVMSLLSVRVVMALTITVPEFSESNIPRFLVSFTGHSTQLKRMTPGVNQKELVYSPVGKYFKRYGP